MKKVAAIFDFEPDKHDLPLLRRLMVKLGLSPDDPDALSLVLNEAICMVGDAQQFGIFSTMKYLLLDPNQQPKSCTLEEWAAWQRTDPDVGVDYTVIGNSAVGTKFISVLPHEDAPCWETNVVGGFHHGLREVCSGNRDQAEQMHAMAVERIRSARPIPPPPVK